MFTRSIPKRSILSPRICGKRISRRFPKTRACFIALLSVMLMSAMVFGQGTGASLTGTATDTSGGVLPGANIVARNVDTGVENRTTSNTAGSYTFPSLPIGMYEISAEASGFSRVTRSVRLNVGGQSRLDLVLSVAGTVTEVSVTGAVESVVLDAGASTGTVMQEEIMSSIPLLSNNIMDLIQIMGGASQITDPSMGMNSQTFAGVAAGNINVTRDGMSVTEVRNHQGIAAATNINQEMIGEFRMVLSPVDAEMGRGAGQVQMTTRSGSNAFHGSVVWNFQNTALDATDYSVKQSGNPPNWRNLNNYMLTASGPIIKNRTFFFVTWEHQMALDKIMTNTKVLTPCARKGIYRYISGWVPGPRNAISNSDLTYNPITGIVPSVNDDGTPLLSNTFKNVNDNRVTQTINGELRIESIFGEFTETARLALLADKGPTGVYGDCSSIAFTPNANNTAWAAEQDTSSFYAAGMLKPNSYWYPETYRYPYDPTGFVSRFTYGADYSDGRVEMPPLNNYDVGDGLNYAGIRFMNPIVGFGNSIWGSGGDPDRKSITFKIDHNINNDHRISGTYTYEYFVVGDHWLLWPKQYGSYSGTDDRKSNNLMISLTSTLRPTVLNEVRFGLSSADTWTNSPLDAKDGDKMRDVLETLFPSSLSRNQLIVVGVGDAPLLFHADPQSGSAANSSHPVGTRWGNIGTTWGGNSPRWSAADTVTWMKGAHSFKGGVDVRWQASRQESYGNRGFAGAASYIDRPVVFGGATGDTSTRRRNAAAIDNAWKDPASQAWKNLWPGSTSTSNNGNFQLPHAMMTYFSGAINQARQYFYAVSDGNTARWNDPSRGEDYYDFTVSNKEISFFFKDDWKVTNDLTLNLGVRYEYYGVPHTDRGMTVRIEGDSARNVFGISEGQWNNWMQNRIYVDAPVAMRTGNTVTVDENLIPDPVTVYTFVGPGSRNSNISAWNKDMNNFAPHLGFAWQLPWFGRGRTTLRGGWSVSYAKVDNFDNFGVWVGDVGAYGTTRMETFSGFGTAGNIDASRYYMDLTDLNDPNKVLPNNGFLAANTEVLPLVSKKVGQLNSGATVIDENIRSPYIHSFNMALTRNIGRSLTVDVRYIGTMSRDLVTNTNLNQSNYISTGLYQELEKIRSSETSQSALLNSLVPSGVMVAGGTGSDQMRNTFNPYAGTGNLAVGNFQGVVNTLSTTNGGLNTTSSTTAGLVSRSGCLPEDRPGYQAAFNAATNDAERAAINMDLYPCQKGTPWNYFYTNPQFSSASLYYNGTLTNYHSMQTQVTLRPTHGLNFQATWTWSRSLGNSGYTNYLADRFEGRDYTLSSQHRTHALNTFGSYELPFGPQGLLLRESSGALKKFVEGWQLSWITSMTTGAPASVTGQAAMWGNSYPILVRPDLWDEKSGKAEWQGISGTYFGDGFTKVIDTNICDPNRMTAALYSANCMGLDTVANSLTEGQMIIRAGAPRALALSSGATDSMGNVLPQRYSSLEEALRYDPYAQMEVDTAGNLQMPSIIVFRNADQREGAGAAGNYSANRLTGVGRFSLDMAASKSVEFMEGKRLEIRVDVQNVLNHATPTNGTSSANGGRFMAVNNPSFAINSTAEFGRFNTKAGHRTFQARLALRF